MPLIPVQLFLNRSFILALIVYMDAVALAWAIIFIMPLYLHNVLSFSTGIVGLILASMTIMTVVAPPLAGYWYDKKSKPMTVHLIFLLSVVSLFLFGFFSTTGPLWLIILAFVMFGFAWGMGNGIAVPLSLSNQANNENAGLVLGALTTAMNIFAVFVLTLDTTLFRFKENSTLLNSIGANGMNIVPRKSATN